MTSTVSTRFGAPIRACRAIFAHPAIDWFAPRERRRAVVAAYVVSLLGFPTAAWLTNSWWPGAVLVLPLLAGTVILAGTTGAIFDRPAGSLDERELHLRRSFLSNPYLVGAVAGIVAGMVVASTFDSDAIPVTAAGVVSTLAVFMLPTLVLAWTMPTEVDDGD